MKYKLECPVDFISVNENKVRITAGGVLLLSVAYLFTGHWIIAAFLTVDFFLRGFQGGKYSPLGILAGFLVKKLRIGNKPIDQAPKIFAARIGFLFADLVLIFNVLQLKGAADGIATILVLFSFLESVLGFCAGCYVYTFLKKLAPGSSWL